MPSFNLSSRKFKTSDTRRTRQAHAFKQCSSNQVAAAHKTNVKINILVIWALICLHLATSQVQSANDFLLQDEGQLHDSTDLADSAQGQDETQQGSWSHWWSYDGVSGPDYWNINKHWRLCSLGRKQSPINIKTERLVYDHLLGPLALDWQPASSARHLVGKQQQQATAAKVEQKTIPVRLINSGRGIEAWLERAPPFDLASGAKSTGPTPEAKTTTTTKIHHHHNHQKQRQQMQTGDEQHEEAEQLILAGGPLAYEYKLFKLELHSGASYASVASAQVSSLEGAAPRGPDQDSAEDDDELRAPKSSEHLINGRPFEAELQLHFYNRHLASGAQEALRWANERPLASLFAIISVFISLRNGSGGLGDNAEATNQSSSSSTQSLGFLLDRLAQLQNQGDSLETRVGLVELDALLPDTKNYVTYQGSLNRPPCAESVDWIILNKALLIDGRKFAQLFERTDTTALENVRPVKPTHGRLLRTTISNLAPGGPSSASQQRQGATECATARNGLKNSATAEDCVNATRNNRRPDVRTTNNQQLHCSMKPSYIYQYSYAANSKGY